MNKIRQRKYITVKEDIAWRVRLRMGDGYYTKQFNYEKFGGKNRALEHAIIWRDALLETHDMIERIEVARTPNYFSRQSKPIIGVYKNKDKYGFRWTTRWSDGEDEIKRHFSVNKYGERKAFQMACKIRYQQCGKLRIVDCSLIPCLPKVPYTILRHQYD